MEGALYTDQYQLTMAQLYLDAGLAERRARFEHFFRRYPDYGRHAAGYCINAGSAWFRHWLRTARFDEPVLERLRSQRTVSGTRLYGDRFLDWLGTVGDFSSLEVTVIPEGRVVHANVPLTVVEGPLAVAQLAETALLNLVNFQTLIATKASRVAEAAEGAPILEFGMRRGPDRGATAGTRAALIGGAGHSSAVGISHALGIEPRGTHAHAMVQVFMATGGTELDAFRAYAQVYPDDCLLLVDTVDTLRSGVPNAITVFEELRAGGHRPVGIRLDSGDLAHLAVESARRLDEAGFTDCAIVLSSGLDELTIWQIRNQINAEGARAGVDPRAVLARLVYGVGTAMATSEGDPSLDGVYKLVAVDGPDGWAPAVKLSDTPAKILNPGRKRVVRVYDRRGQATADLLCLAGEEVDTPISLHHPSEGGMSRTLTEDQVSSVEDLLTPLDLDLDPDEGELVRAARERRDADLDRLDPGVRRIINPHVYHVSLSTTAWELRQSVVRDLLAGR
ncbi:MAG: nicotinate phosphoribosyltransferase [Acidimicrobiales bacterium]